MRYLVTMELIGTPPNSQEELLRHLEEVVIPNHKILMKLEAEGKILAGGDLTGRRASVFIIEAESNAEVSQLLSMLPLWTTQEVDVIPLETFEERQEMMHLKLAGQLKGETS